VTAPRPLNGVILVLVIGWSFIGAGLLAWQLEPGNSIGTAMIVTGFLWFVAALAKSQDLLPFASGRALEVAYLAGVNYVVLAFPRGRREPASTAGFRSGDLRSRSARYRATRLRRHDPESCVGCPTTLVIEVVNAPSIVRVLELF
jgi:hypothetical protein